jgi:hypothetical protein
MPLVRALPEKAKGRTRGLAQLLYLSATAGRSPASHPGGRAATNRQSRYKPAEPHSF